MTTVSPPPPVSSSTPVTDACAALRELFGHADFRAGQEEIVSAVLAGEDVPLCTLPTG